MLTTIGLEYNTRKRLKEISKGRTYDFMINNLIDLWEFYHEVNHDEY